jgi:hypothetical protein
MHDCDQLLVMLTVQLLRGPRTPFDGTGEQIASMLHQLRAHYVDAGTPYGDDEQGFQRWLLDWWPAPMAA